MKTIVAATALEAQGDAVIGRAMQLAKQHGARLALVHVIEAGEAAEQPLPGVLDGRLVRDMLKAEARARIREAIAACKIAVSPEIVIAEGRPFEAIDALVRERAADLLVIGPGVAKGIREKMFGSTVDHLVRAAPVPVLVVRSGDVAPYRQATVAMNFTPPSLAASRAARAIAPAAVIEHLHVVEIPLGFEQAMLKAGTSQAQMDQYRRAREAEGRQRLKAFIEANRQAGPARGRIVSGDARAILVKRSRGARTDLLALGAHSRGVISQTLLGSVARRVLQAAACDVLIAPG